MWVQVDPVPSIHQCTDCMRLAPVWAGMRQLGLEQYRLERQQWLRQTGDHTPLVGLFAISKRTYRVSRWYCQILSRSCIEHSVSDWWSGHLTPIMLQRLQESQSDWGVKSGALMNLKMCSANMHFHSQFGYAWLQAEMGVPVSVFESLSRFWNQMRQEFCPVSLLGASMKTPESGMDQNLVEGETLAARQSVQWKAASPPADSPLSTRWVTLVVNIPRRRLAQANWAIVTSCPRKQRSAPLQRMGWERVPWWPDPSQYFRNTFVHVRKQFCSSSDSMPSVNVCVGLQPEELPKSDLLLLQQFYMVEGRSLSPHQPPPSKNINTLAGSPRERQKAPREPSRQRA